MMTFRNISKSFAGVRALSDVSIAFEEGKIHAICGENGAGKSTLMNIATGNLQPDTGTILLGEKVVTLNSAKHAQDLSISMVHQEGSLSESMSVAENIFANRQPLNAAGLINYGELYRRAAILLKELHSEEISPGTLVYRLSAEQKKLIEIAKALASCPSFLVLDEPTASLTNSKTEILFSILRTLKRKGVTVVYISHRMEEIMKIADTITVLKDGTWQGTVPAAASTIDGIVRMMVGRDLQTVQRNASVGVEKKLELKAVSGPGFSNVTFDLYKGEIFGLAGLQGSGRTALAQTIFGDLPLTSGSITFNGKVIRSSHPRDAVDAGIAYVPEDRKTHGLFLEKSIAENIAATRLHHGTYQRRTLSSIATKFINQLAIKAPSADVAVKQLSGGNQQKVVLAKWLARHPDLLLINEPTHGVDVGAKSEIYRLLFELTEQGKSILLISSDLPELLSLTDRIGVMYRGNLVKIFSKDDATEESITSVASGVI